MAGRRGYHYVDSDFRPAPPGWRLIWLDQDRPHGWWGQPIAGWMIQDYTAYSGQRGLQASVEDGLILDDCPRRVVPAVLRYDGTIAAVTNRDTDGLVNTLGPGEPDPTPDEIATALRNRAL